MLEINFFWGVAITCYLISKVVSNLVANTGGPVTGHCQINDQTNFLDNAFDHMDLCFVIYVEQLFQ